LTGAKRAKRKGACGKWLLAGSTPLELSHMQPLAYADSSLELLKLVNDE